MLHHFPALALFLVAAIVFYETINMAIDDYRQFTGRETKTVSNNQFQITLQYVLRVFIVTVCLISGFLLW